jgi:hypothetical protein
MRIVAHDEPIMYVSLLLFIYIVRAQFGLVHMFILQIMHMMSITWKQSEKINHGP